MRAGVRRVVNAAAQTALTISTVVAFALGLISLVFTSATGLLIRM
jgi:hypothetical protein